MAHVAKIENINGVWVVNDIQSVSNDVENPEQFMEETFGGIWKQTSYNTFKNVHLLGGQPFRGTYAEIGGTYDEINDRFIPQKPYPSWTFDEQKYEWIAPLPEPEPSDTMYWSWNESTFSWDGLAKSELYGQQ